jgi:AGZA family xanthine/uracil permease-like MFS transporter
MSAVTASARRPVGTGRLDRFFEISARGSTVARELRGGFTTYFTMVYIVVLNPLIIGTVRDVDGRFLGGGSAPDLPLIAAATALVAGVLTILMGAVANYPVAIATGLGLNAFVAFTVASRVTWREAMGLVVLEGLVIVALVATGFRTAVFRAVPAPLRAAITVGIGLFIAIVGLVDAGIVRPGTGTPLQLGIGGNLDGWPVTVFVVGLLLTAVLYARRVPGAILIGIVVATTLALIAQSVFDIGPQTDATGKVVHPTGWSLNVPSLSGSPVATPDFGLLGQVDLVGAFSRIGVLAVVVLVFTLVLSDFFDTMGTVVGIGSQAGLLDADGNPPRTGRILFVDGAAAVAGGLGAVSSNTAYVESASGVGEGARTGLASVVTGVLFLLTTFLAPLASVVPYEAAAPALVLVGFLMMSQVRNVAWDDVAVGIPVFLTAVLMPYTYSITTGIGAGFISYVLLMSATGRARRTHPLLWVVAVLFVAYFFLAPINRAVG